jgi:hypothetical protein
LPIIIQHLPPNENKKIINYRGEIKCWERERGSDEKSGKKIFLKNVWISEAAEATAAKELIYGEKFLSSLQVASAAADEYDNGGEKVLNNN